MNQLRLYYPCKPFVLNQGFGVDSTNASLVQKYKELGLKGHNGWDMQAHDGEIVRAAHDGVVTLTGEDGAGGLGIVIRTNEQFDYLGGQAYFKTLYWHLQKGSFKVKAGQKVRAGDVIASADNTGMSTGSHLHFGLKPEQKGESNWQWFNLEPDNGYQGAIDPKPYFSGICAEDKAFENIPATLVPVAKLFIKMFNL